MTIIEINARPDNGHGLQSQSGRTSCWLDGWVEVPAHLESSVWDCIVYCELDIQDGKLVGITPTERPEQEPVPEIPTQEDRISALESAMLAMMMGGTTDV